MGSAEAARIGVVIGSTCPAEGGDCAVGSPPLSLGPPTLRAHLEALILALTWDDSPPGVEGMPAAPFKEELAREYANILVIEGRDYAGRSEAFYRLRGDLDAARDLSAAIRASAVRRAQRARATNVARREAEGKPPTKSEGGRKPDRHAIRIAGRCRDISELATGKSGNHFKTDYRKSRIGVIPFVAAVFAALGIDPGAVSIEAKASGCVKTIEMERRRIKKKVEGVDSLDVGQDGIFAFVLSRALADRARLLISGDDLMQASRNPRRPDEPSSLFGTFVNRQRLAAPDMLNCPTSTIARYCRAGMPHIRPPNSQRVWFDPEACKAWFRQQQVSLNPPDRAEPTSKTEG